jgi:hypothetical protein
MRCGDRSHPAAKEIAGEVVMIAGVEPLRGGLRRRLNRQGRENLRAVCTIGDQGRAGTRRKDEHKYPQRQHDRGPARRRKGRRLSQILMGDVVVLLAAARSKGSFAMGGGRQV